MVSIPQIPQTLVKIGRYDLSLEEAVKKFSEPSHSTPFGSGNTIKYATFKSCERPYLLMISQQKDKILHPAGYNIIVTATSYYSSINQEAVNQFQRETGIDLNIPVPNFLIKQSYSINLCFSAFEKDPETAMNFLRGSY